MQRGKNMDLPDVINRQFREFPAELFEPVHFLSPDQQSGIHITA